MKIEKLIGQIQSIDKGLKKEANKAVNQLLTIRNWLIGHYIMEYEQKGEDRAEYGNRLLQTLSEKLKKRGLSGYSYSYLNLYRQFFFMFPEILQTLSGEFKINKTLIVQTLSAQTKMPLFESLQKSKCSILKT